MQGARTALLLAGHPEPEAKLTNDLCPRRPDEGELTDEREEKKPARGDASNVGVAPWTLA